MRCIDNTNLTLPEGWEERAREAKEAVRNGSKSINDQSSVWCALKDTLADKSNDKCWYCEIKQERSDNAVDHFRPKNRVADTNPPHDGYWWLAFDPSNFRYSCTFCNSLRKNPDSGETEGKGDKFPLLDGSPRASNPGEEANENPVLLDPCNTADPGLLDFLDNGQPCARYPDHDIRRQRAEQSIKLYHLDHPALIEQRKALAGKIKSWINKADRLFDRCDTGDPTIDQAFDGFLASLRDAISERAELSVFARKVIAGFRDKVWVEQLLMTA
jgi:uncharacterized protein (TIGR02646 family)